MISIVCDSEWCEYNEDGFCEKEKVSIVNMSCNSNRYREEKGEEKHEDNVNG